MFLRKTTSPLSTAGVPTRARVVSFRLQGGDRTLASRKIDGVMSGATSVTRARVELDVVRTNGVTRRVTVRSDVPMMSIGRMVAGSEVQVLVDPARPERVEIDWGHGVLVPGTAQVLSASGMGALVGSLAGADR